MSKEHRIHTVVDMLNLSPDEFLRMLPDLAAWYAIAKPLHGMQCVTSRGFVWVDDGMAGKVSGVTLTDPATGKVTEYRL